jgi:hypothetical protein
MADEIKNGMPCTEFETLLFEAVDGTLVAGTLTRFRTHASGCASCGPLFADAQAGQQWMQSLAEVEPPKNLVHNILAKTSGVAERYVESVAEQEPSRWGQAFGWLQPVLSGTWATVRQPRFGMSVAMAFFSVSLVMSVTGTKVNDLAKLDLRPSAVKRGYYATQARVVKYYTNMRFVYEIESRLQDIKRATVPAEGEPIQREQKKERRKEKDNDKTSGRPSKGPGGNGEDRKQDRNYAQDDTQPVMAQAEATGNADGDSDLWINAARREA